MIRPRAPQYVVPDWFVCVACNRSQAFAPQDRASGITVEEAEGFGWLWTDEGWLCPLHSGTERAATYEHKPHEHLTRGFLAFFLAVAAASFAVLAFRAAALAWCWNHLAVYLWVGAPRVQAWGVFGLLVLRPLVWHWENDEADLSLSEKVKKQRARITSYTVDTALSWGAVWLLLRVFG